jgi:hypothetical protein
MWPDFVFCAEGSDEPTEPQDAPIKEISCDSAS